MGISRIDSNTPAREPQKDRNMIINGDATKGVSQKNIGQVGEQCSAFDIPDFSARFFSNRELGLGHIQPKEQQTADGRSNQCFKRVVPQWAKQLAKYL